MQIDTSKWSGEGEFTQKLVDRLQHIDGVAFLRVEDAPASRTEADYNFISNEIYIGFAVATRTERVRRFGFLPGSTTVEEKALTMAAVAAALTASDGIGEPDYADEGMLQYLRTERIVPPYQTRGYKLVEMVRLYEAGAERRS
jgi:hypothetical protein